MKITFILNNLGLSGGVKIVFQYANQLTAMGHDVCVLYPSDKSRNFSKWAYPRKTIRRFLSDRRNFRYWCSKTSAKITKVPELNEYYIPDADVIVATWWKTAYRVNEFSEIKGKKFYFIQHYEVWGGPKDQVDESYKLGLKNIVISTWLKETLEQIDAPVEALILNSIDINEFFPERIKRNDNDIRILMPYRNHQWKGVSDGLTAVEIVRRKFKNIKLVMFGPKANGLKFTSQMEFHTFPRGAKLRKVYNSCDIFLFPSHCEGFGLPPMEAMACKIPVVTTNVGAIPDYAVAGETAMVSPPRDVNAMAENIIELIEDCQKRKTMAENAYQYIKQFTWETSARKLEQVFKKQL